MTTYSKLHEATNHAHTAAMNSGTLEEYWNQIGDAAHAVDEGLITFEEARQIVSGERIDVAA